MSASEAGSTGTKPIIRYIIVVHGIGEQRKNETVLHVINRFSEARRALNAKLKKKGS